MKAPIRLPSIYFSSGFTKLIISNNPLKFPYVVASLDFLCMRVGVRSWASYLIAQPKAQHYKSRLLYFQLAVTLRAINTLARNSFRRELLYWRGLGPGNINALEISLLDGGPFYTSQPSTRSLTRTSFMDEIWRSQADGRKWTLLWLNDFV